MDPTEVMIVEEIGMIQDMFPARDLLKSVRFFYSSHLVAVYGGNKLTLLLRYVPVLERVCCVTVHYV